MEKIVDDRLNSLEDQVTALKSIIQLDVRVTPDQTEYIPISLPDGSEYRMLADTFFKSRFRTESGDYPLVASDRNSTIEMTGVSATLTIPDSLGWNKGDKCFVIQNNTGLTIASGGSVTTNEPQTLADQQYSIYVIIKTDTDIFTVAQIGTASGGGGAVDSVFGRTGVVTAQSGDYDTDDVTEATNLYYTEVRVAANSAVTANTAKVGVTTEEANTIDSDVSGEYTGADQILNVVSSTEAEHTAGAKISTTLYIITDA